MNVTNYLEAFLEVYDWEVYKMLYFIIAMTGLFLYPILRELLGIYLDFLADEEKDDNKYLGEAIAIIFVTLLIFFISVVPMVPMDLSQTKLKTVCETSETAISDHNPNGDYFKNTKTRVPIMPWFAMAVGQGINGVIYNTTPCTMDITLATKAIWNANLDGDKALKEEYMRFKNECHTRAVNIIQTVLRGDYGEELQKKVELRVTDAIKENVALFGIMFGEADDPRQRDLVLYGLDSPLLQNSFYKTDSPDYKNLTAGGPVEGLTGDPGDGSASPDAPPTCGDWWNGQGGKQGLRIRLVNQLSNSTIQQVAASHGIFDYLPCKGKGQKTNAKGQTYWDLTEEDMQACRTEVTNKVFAGNDDALVRKLLEFDQGNFASDTVLSQREKTSLGNAISSLLVASVFSLFSDVDLTGGVLQTVVGFYAGLFLLKLLLKFLLPMVLMTIYMFWGVYLVVARLSMQAVIRGMLLIGALTIVPSIWAVMDHLDDKLWESMHGDSGLSSPFDMVLLDAASTAFYLAAVLIVFYLINLGDSVDPRAVVNGSQNNVNNVSQSLGNNVGSSAGKAGGNIYKGAKGMLAGGISGIRGGFKNLWRR